MAYRSVLLIVLLFSCATGAQESTEPRQPTTETEEPQAAGQQEPENAGGEKKPAPEEEEPDCE